MKRIMLITLISTSTTFFLVSNPPTVLTKKDDEKKTQEVRPEAKRPAQPHPQNVQLQQGKTSTKSNFVRTPSMSRVDPKPSLPAIHQNPAASQKLNPKQISPKHDVPAVHHNSVTNQKFSPRQVVPPSKVENSQLKKNIIRTPSMSRSDLQRHHPIIQGSSKQSPKLDSKPIPVRSVPSSLQKNTQPHEMKAIEKNRDNPNLSGSRNQVKERLLKSKQSRSLSDRKHRNSGDPFLARKQIDRQSSHYVQNQIRRTHPDHRRWFSDHFFDHHHYHPHYHHSGDNWWRTVHWIEIANWIIWRWSFPIYYDEGIAIDLSPDIEPLVPIDQTDTNGLLGDWFPLGVFAVGREVNQASFSNMFLQLAISKDGDIAGTYYNALTDQTYELNGTVDPESQQVAWKLTDNPDSPIMTTGIYNLTQDVVSIQVYFQNGIEQNWVLVRLTEP